MLVPKYLNTKFSDLLELYSLIGLGAPLGLIWLSIKWELVDLVDHISHGGLQFNVPCTFWIICPWRSSSCYAKSLLKMFEKRVRKVFKRKKSDKIYFLHFFNDNKKPGKRAEAKNSFDFFQDCSLGFLMNRFLASESPMNSSHLEKAREI